MTRAIVAALALSMLAPAYAAGPHQLAIECYDGSRRTVHIVVETCDTLAECRADAKAEAEAAKIQCAPHDWKVTVR